jgi:hypothetical protein
MRLRAFSTHFGTFENAKLKCRENISIAEMAKSRLSLLDNEIEVQMCIALLESLVLVDELLSEIEANHLKDSALAWAADLFANGQHKAQGGDYLRNTLELELFDLKLQSTYPARVPDTYRNMKTLYSKCKDNSASDLELDSLLELVRLGVRIDQPVENYAKIAAKHRWRKLEHVTAIVDFVCSQKVYPRYNNYDWIADVLDVCNSWRKDWDDRTSPIWDFRLQTSCARLLIELSRFTRWGDKTRQRIGDDFTNLRDADDILDALDNRVDLHIPMQVRFTKCLLRDKVSFWLNGVNITSIKASIERYESFESHLPKDSNLRLWGHCQAMLGSRLRWLNEKLDDKDETLWKSTFERLENSIEAIPFLDDPNTHLDFVETLADYQIEHLVAITSGYAERDEIIERISLWKEVVRKFNQLDEVYRNELERWRINRRFKERIENVRKILAPDDVVWFEKIVEELQIPSSDEEEEGEEDDW